jgi:hypothetical protein
MKPHPNSGYSAWAYIIDPEYATDPGHYVRALNLIQNDLRSLFEFIEPSDKCKEAYSYRVHALLMRACIEVEANFKAIFRENIFSKSKPSMTDYKKIDKTHRLSSYEVLLPMWDLYPRIFKPFEPWKAGHTLPWYQAYNASKHNRHEAFKRANLENLVSAVAGLLVVISSQFMRILNLPRATFKLRDTAITAWTQPPDRSSELSIRTIGQRMTSTNLIGAILNLIPIASPRLIMMRSVRGGLTQSRR